MKLKRFKKGGVHPVENKLSKDAKIEALALPKVATIFTSQHLGAPAKPVVKKGDPVKAGTLIAEAGGFISANIHSPFSGTVSKVATLTDGSGYLKQAIEITVEGDEWAEGIDTSSELVPEITLTPEQIIERVQQCGIVGLGGATFPSNVKLMVPKGKTAEVVVINAVECEPYLTSDHRVMLEKADEIMVGISIAMQAVGVNKAIIGVENNKPDAIKHLSEVAKNYIGIEIQALRVQYPQGAEKQVLDAVLDGKEIPAGGLPIDVGAVILNVGTTLAIYEAVQKNKPLVERVVTVTGKSVKKPANYLARIGTPLNDLIEASGGLPEDTGKIINGGPMMGKSISTTNTVVTKGTSGILIMKEEEAHRKDEAPCIRCGKCVTVCPLGLEPYLLASMTKVRQYEGLECEAIMNCCECGSCSYTCPAALPLLDYVRLGKSETGKILRARK